jgi:hypothetical protein
MANLTRHSLVAAGASTVAMPWIARAAAPEYRLKIGNIVSGDHPINTVMGKGREKILKDTDGKSRKTCGAGLWSTAVTGSRWSSPRSCATSY